MSRKLQDTSLVVTAVLLAQSQTSLMREERGENLILLAMTDTETGEKGHLLYMIAVDKRDIEAEEQWTDNPALFEKNRLDSSEMQDVLNFSDEHTPRERTPETDAIMSACYDNELTADDAGLLVVG
jgi:hypothetical protein